jgi:hypothetical protein
VLRSGISAYRFALPKPLSWTPKKCFLAQLVSQRKGLGWSTAEPAMHYYLLSSVIKSTISTSPFLFFNVSFYKEYKITQLNAIHHLNYKLKFVVLMLERRNE